MVGQGKGVAGWLNHPQPSLVGVAVDAAIEVKDGGAAIALDFANPLLLAEETLCSLIYMGAKLTLQTTMSSLRHWFLGVGGVGVRGGIAPV